MSNFVQLLERLKGDLLMQGNRVVEMLHCAVDTLFDGSIESAQSVIESDNTVDQVDVAIEQASIPLLSMGETNEYHIRSILTIVKVNNELERIADRAVNIAQAVIAYHEDEMQDLPPTFRVMGNSIIGMVRDAVQSLKDGDVPLAEQVLNLDDTIDRFKDEIGLDAEKHVASGEYEVRYGFRLRTIAAQYERIADHATNISEQVIYLETGKTVRHLEEGWTKPEDPA